LLSASGKSTFDSTSEADIVFATTLALLRSMLGANAEFRKGQWEAIEAAVVHRRRVLVVQRTGWGKSAVYFLATRLLRDRGSGPALLVSPLLSLMRDQLRSAERIGVRAATINSGNRDEWELVEAKLADNAVDLLMVSPERLGNAEFRTRIMSMIGGKVGLLVIDEAHCISDWGHDFRPDYRRIKRLLDHLPPSVPVIATTATANNRVTADVAEQLGRDVLTLRGPLARESLRLQNLAIGDPAARLAWLATNLPKFKGVHGIIYCLTVADCERVSGWLKRRGLAVEPYHADLSPEDREAREAALRENRIHKPDLGFVIHFQRPGSVISYYQQVGRAGRALAKAYGILLAGDEDDEIAEYFIASAFPNLQTFEGILAALGPKKGMSRDDLFATVNASPRAIETALKILEVDGAVGVESGKHGRQFFRTPNPWRLDVERVERITGLRRSEQEQMRRYVRHTGCLMEFLAKALDDPAAKPCGVCANCQKKGFASDVEPAVVAEARRHLCGADIEIEPRQRWPAGLLPERPKLTILPEEKIEPGRVLSLYADGGWGRLVRLGKYERGEFGDDLVEAAVALIRERWKPTPNPQWVTAIPSPRRPRLVGSFAERLATRLGLPFVAALSAADAPEQKTMANSYRQSRNARGMLRAEPFLIRPGPVLLVDDMIDSRWTMTVAGALLRSHGCSAVFPFALARSTPRDGF
jgi:ATP-dependent DNA helicase RecQ